MRLCLSLRREGGNVLLASLSAMVVIGLALLTYLTLAKNQNQFVARSQTWNACLPLAEAGIEDALTHLAWNGTNMVSSGWALSGTNSYYRTNALAGGWYSVTISTNLQPASIISAGYMTMAGGTGAVARRVKVEAVKMPPYRFAIKSRAGISFSGNNCLVDSYDSRDPAKSTGGQYDPAKAGDEADVACMASGNGSVRIQNGNIWGHAFIPVGSSISMGPNGKVGSKAWQLSGNKGVQPGWVRTDLNVSIPDATVPFSGGVPPLPGFVGGVTWYSAIFDGGIFDMPFLNGRVIVTQPSYVRVRGNINVSELVIQTNASLILYCDGASTRFNNVDNKPGLASALIYFGLPTNTSIDLDESWLGAVYAPSADFSIAGNREFNGSLTARSVELKGGSAVHFDVALANPTNTAGSMTIISWTEL